MSIRCQLCQFDEGVYALIEEGYSIIWDEWSHESFDTLNKSLELTLVLSPPNNSHDFLLYVVVYQEMIGMVLFQADDDLQEHVIYYLI